MTSIDYLGFDHVVDEILSYSTPETLLAFRDTCHYMRAKVDHLIQHLTIKVAVTCPENKPSATPRTSYETDNTNGSETTTPSTSCIGDASAREHSQTHIRVTSRRGWTPPPIHRLADSTSTPHDPRAAAAAAFTNSTRNDNETVEDAVACRIQRRRVLSRLFASAEVVDLFGPVNWPLPGQMTTADSPSNGEGVMNLFSPAINPTFNPLAATRIAPRGTARLFPDEHGLYPLSKLIAAPTVVLFTGLGWRGVRAARGLGGFPRGVKKIVLRLPNGTFHSSLVSVSKPASVISSPTLRELEVVLARDDDALSALVTSYGRLLGPDAPRAAARQLVLQQHWTDMACMVLKTVSLPSPVSCTLVDYGNTVDASWGAGGLTHLGETAPEFIKGYAGQARRRRVPSPDPVPEVDNEPHFPGAYPKTPRQQRRQILKEMEIPTLGAFRYLSREQYISATEPAVLALHTDV